jgi:hypothetical protein
MSHIIAMSDAPMISHPLVQCFLSRNIKVTNAQKLICAVGCKKLLIPIAVYNGTSATMTSIFKPFFDNLIEREIKKTSIYRMNMLIRKATIG